MKDPARVRDLLLQLPGVEGGRVYVNLFIGSEAELALPGG